MGLLKDGLVSFWECSEGAGTTTADATANASTMTFNTAGWGTGISGGGLSLDATHNLSGTLNNAPVGASIRSVSVWFNCSSFGSNDTILGWGTNADTQAFQLQVNTSSVLNFSGWNDDTTWAVSLSTSTWYHWALMYDGATTVYSYLNGAPLGNKTIASPLNTTGTTLKFGVAVNAGAMITGGVLDQIGVWNRLLTEGEVRQLYNSGVGLAYPLSFSSNIGNRFSYIEVGNGMSRSEGAT